MDKKINNAGSTADAFFFQLIPKYFRVQHAFAKNIKPSTAYRLSIFKGIQKADEMAEPIKSKLVGGKIIFDKTVLNFYLPLYSPARNIEFTVKVLQTKPNEQELEIASFKIKSGDYIKQFRSDNLSYSSEEVSLMESFALVFDLFVHSSKAELQKIVNISIQKSKLEGRSSLLDKKGNRTPRKNEVSSEILSQSDASETNSRNSGAFASKKRLMRKRGHDGKLKSKNGSRQGSEVGSSRSRSSRKSFGPFPHNEQNQHYVRSPKKVSPPKVEDHSNIESNVKLAKRQNLVTVGRKQSEIKNEKIARNATPTKIGRVEINRERSESAHKPKRSSILDINTPITDRKGNANAKAELHQLQIATKQNMFEIKNKNQAKSPPASSKVIPPKSPSKPVQVLKINEPKVVQQPQPAVQQPISKPTLQQEKPKTQEEEKEPEAEHSDNFSGKQDRKISAIKIKQKPLIEEGEREKPEKKMKASVRLPSAASLQPEAEQQQAGKEYDSLKDKIFYVVFVIVSAILFWNAVTPSRKV